MEARSFTMYYHAIYFVSPGQSFGQNWSCFLRAPSLLAWCAPGALLVSSLPWPPPGAPLLMPVVRACFRPCSLTHAAPTHRLVARSLPLLAPPYLILLPMAHGASVRPPTPLPVGLRTLQRAPGHDRPRHASSSCRWCMRAFAPGPFSIGRSLWALARPMWNPGRDRPRCAPLSCLLCPFAPVFLFQAIPLVPGTFLVAHPP